MTDAIQISPRHLSWAQVNELLDLGAPVAYPVEGSPECEVRLDADREGMALRIGSPAEVEATSLALREVGFRTLHSGGRPWIEISIRNPPLLADFYALICSIADRVQLDGLEPVTAITTTIDAWSHLLQRRKLISEEKEIGLIGELWFLSFIATKIGWPHALTAWRGAESEEHDFGLASVDIEVKTTVGERRSHFISSLTQMVPSPGRPLLVASIQLTGAGDQTESLSLPELVDVALERASEASDEHARRARTLLEGLQWRDADRDYYRRRFRLRTEPVVIPVDKHFPSIVPSTLQSLGDRVRRILQASYRVDLSDLGADLRSPQGARMMGMP